MVMMIPRSELSAAIDFIREDCLSGLSLCHSTVSSEDAAYFFNQHILPCIPLRSFPAHEQCAPFQIVRISDSAEKFVLLLLHQLWLLGLGPRIMSVIV